MSDKQAPLPADAIEMSPERVACAQHREPFRARWPMGYPIFMVTLFQRVVGRDSPKARGEAFWEEPKKLVPAEDASPKELIEAALSKTPLCCRVTPTELEAAYDESGVGVRAVCEGCGRKRLGTPFRTRAQRWGHMCFGCVIHNFQPLN